MTTGADVPADHRSLLLGAYVAYNSRAVDTLLALVADDVDWPDDARRLHGKQQVRAYWTEQWARTLTHDEPRAFAQQRDGRTAVSIHQVVCAPDGSVISKGEFRHVHRIEASLIAALHVSALR